MPIPNPVTQALTGADFRVTRVASTGGLLRRGMTTLLIGLEAEQVDPAIQLLRQDLHPLPTRGKTSHSLRGAGG